MMATNKRLNVLAITMVIIVAFVWLPAIAVGQSPPNTDELQPLDQLAELQTVQKQMAEVRDDLAANMTAPAAQQRQQAIIDSLAKLLDQQNQQQNQESAAESTQEAKPKKEPEDSDFQGKKSKTDSETSKGSDRSDEKDAGLSKEMQDKIWGHLPQRLRDRMRNVDGERFLPKYERLIRAYYERLAGELSKD